MAVQPQTAYYLPPGYQAERTRGMFVLRRPDGSVALTLGGQRTIGEIVERYAWEDSVERKGGRVERACERFSQLPAPIALGLLWLVGAVPVGLCAVAVYYLWLMLLTVAGG
jgi:hypothetical protein